MKKTKKHIEIIKNIKNEKSKRVSKVFSEVKEKLSNSIELPRYLVSNVSKITMIDNESLFIERYNAIDEYYTHYIKISGNNINIIVDGKDLDIKEITDEDILVIGQIFSVNFKKA